MDNPAIALEQLIGRVQAWAENDDTVCAAADLPDLDSANEAADHSERPVIEMLPKRRATGSN